MKQADDESERRFSDQGTVAPISSPELAGQPSPKLLGQIGEQLALQTLAQRGYRIVQCSFRCKLGEIDLVTEERGELVFVEVKTRRGTAFGLPEEAVTWRKQRKLIAVAAYYRSLHGCEERSWRIDVVAVQFRRNGSLQEIRVYPHAVQAIE
jgi:putative endonuclease